MLRVEVSYFMVWFLILCAYSLSFGYILKEKENENKIQI